MARLKDKLYNRVIEGDLELSEEDKSNNVLGASTLYRHHFDIPLNHTDLSEIPEGSTVTLNVNAISSSGESWEKLRELDGGGFIVTAFAMLGGYIFELKIYYKALDMLFIQISDINNGTVGSYVVSTVGGGSTPSTFPILDSVTRI